MENKEIKKMQKDLDNMYSALKEVLSADDMDLVGAIVTLELELEAECNKWKRTFSGLHEFL